MRIGIDARSLQEKNLTGVGEYTLQIIREILDQGREHEIRLFTSGAAQRPLPDLGLARHPRAVVKRLARPNKIISASNILFSRPNLDQYLGRLDVFFSPNFNFVSLSEACPQVITIHDLSFEIFPEFFSGRRRLWHRALKARWQAEQADHIICDSRSTAQDVIDIYGVSPHQITVVPLAVEDKLSAKAEPSRIKTVLDKYKLSEKFYLSVGTLEPRKNLLSLLAAYRSFRDSGGTAELVLAGLKGWRVGGFDRALKDHKYRRDIKVLGFVNKSDRQVLYWAALALVATSSYEGFGLPALEALRCGTPLIAANTSSLPEVAGQAALLVDPERPAEIARALSLMANDPVLRASLIKKGQVLSRDFSWHEVGKKTLSVLRGVVANREWGLQNMGLSPREKISTIKR